MKKIFNLFLLFTVGYALNAQDGLPANPKAGMCYVKCIVPDEFGEENIEIMTDPAYSTIRVIPATFKTVEETVLVKEATKRFVYVPAVYETVEVPYIGNEAYKTLSVSPASFNPSSVTHEVYPTTSGWEYTVDPNCKSPNPYDCIVACFKEYPSRSRTVATRNLANDASVSENMVPERPTTYKKQVIKTPPRVDEIEIPAEYATIKRVVVDQPAKTETVTVPAVYTTIKKTVLTKKGGFTVWEELDCDLLEPNVLPILWDFNSSVLNQAAKNTIDEHLLKFLREKSNLRVEIMSHTDSRGSDSYNQTLSQARAQSVVNYLVSRGVSRNRLVAKGYGSTMLKNRCAAGVECSEEEHQANRRTEFKVLSN
jgi:outer membrane protein OmpA-like peptidoglycan-associated protein